jgi:adenylate cyclase
VTVQNRELLRAYGKSLAIAYIIAACLIPTTLPFGVGRSLLMSALTGFLFGTSFFLLTTVRDKIRLPSFALNLLYQTALVSITFLIGGLVAVWAGLAIFSGSSPFDPALIRTGIGYLKPSFVILGLTAGTVVAGIVNALFAIDRKMGPGNIWNWVTGKYYDPREEERIFMFLDMKDSTALAEQLGNLKFSGLVRDFFRDLTYPTLETKGQVSRYIGDEAVLTWKVNDGLQDANCVQLFFKMRAAIEAREPHYLASYGHIPKFKAGLHIGKVVATEVGEIKSEIVFHGDVLNTAARIQGLCGPEEVPLLLSGDLAERLQENGNLNLRSLGMRKLKGKAQELELFTAELHLDRPRT